MTKNATNDCSKEAKSLALLYTKPDDSSFNVTSVSQLVNHIGFIQAYKAAYKNDISYLKEKLSCDSDEQLFELLGEIQKILKVRNYTVVSWSLDYKNRVFSELIKSVDDVSFFYFLMGTVEKRELFLNMFVGSDKYNELTITKEQINLIKTSSCLRTFSPSKQTTMNAKPENSVPIYIKLYNTCMDIVKHPFNLAYKFIGTKIGYFLTVSLVLLGLAAFIALTTYGLPVTATALLVSGVLGSFVGAAVGGALQQCSFFKGRPNGDDVQTSLKQDNVLTT
jgi:hypothetical protein